MGLLVCKKCNKEKEATTEFFPPHKRMNNGLDSWCRICRRQYRKLYRKPPDGITKQDWHQYDKDILNCVICGAEETKLVIDHCHNTKFVRGKLCMHCNLGLGHFKDDPQLLEFARIYLLKNSHEKDNQTIAEEYLNNE